MLYLDPRDDGCKLDGRDDTGPFADTVLRSLETKARIGLPPGAKLGLKPKPNEPAILFPSGGIAGPGRMAAQIVKLGDGALFGISGADTVNRATYAKFSDFNINGAGKTGPVFQTYYADNLVFEDIVVRVNYDVVLDAVELWDTRFERFITESCGSTQATGLPNFLIRNASSPNGWGASRDNSNQVYFSGCRWEDFTHGAIHIEQGDSSNVPNGFYFGRNKMESSRIISGPILKAHSAARHVVVDTLYIYAGNYGPGASQPIVLVDWAPAGGSELRTLLVSCRDIQTVDTALLVTATGTTTIGQVVGTLGADPKTSLIRYNGGAGTIYRTGPSAATRGALKSGTAPAGGVYALTKAS